MAFMADYSSIEPRHSNTLSSKTGTIPKRLSSWRAK
jgi:hypothetical protein